MSIGGGGCYHFGGDNVGFVSCGSPRFLGGFLGRRNGVLPHHVANASVGCRHHITRTIGETHRLTLLPFMASVVGWLGRRWSVRVVLGRSIVNLNCGGSVIGMGSNCKHGCLVPAKGTIVTSRSTGGILTRSLGRHTRGLRGVGGSTLILTRGLNTISLAVPAGIDTANIVCNSMGDLRLTSRLGGLNFGVSHGIVIIGSIGRINSCMTAIGLRGRISIRVPFRIVTRRTWSSSLWQRECEGRRNIHV